MVIDLPDHKIKSSNQSSAQNTFAVVSRLVPGYKSYAEKENLRINDTLIRRRSEDILKVVRGLLERKKSDLLEKQQFEVLSRVSRVADRCLLVENTCQSMVRGYSALFETKEVNVTLLEQILNSDRQLVESASRMEGLAESEIGEDTLSEINNALDQCEKVLRARTILLKDS